MPASLYDRIAARGFPSSMVVGETGSAALADQGGPTKPEHGENVSTAAPSQVQTGFTAEPPAPPDIVLLEGTWGLPGTLTDPDQTPVTHAAPFPGRAGSYAPSDELNAMHENSAAIHSADFGALARHHTVQGIPEPVLDIWSSNEPGENVLQSVRGPLQAMGGYDDTQGYTKRNRFGFDAGHRKRTVASDGQPLAFLDSSERPFIVPQTAPRFVPTDAVQGPVPDGQFRDAGDINTTPPTVYAPPPEPVTASAGPAGGPSSAGWW